MGALELEMINGEEVGDGRGEESEVVVAVLDNSGVLQ